MTELEKLVRRMVPSMRIDIRPFTYAVEVAERLVFDERVPMEEIAVTKDIYPVVAKRLRKRPATVSRSVVRIAHACWESADAAFWQDVIGRDLPALENPSDLIFYLAVYFHLGEPFFSAPRFPPAAEKGKHAVV